MKTLLLTLLIALLITATSVNTLKTEATEDLWATPELPEGISREPMPDNYTTEDYLNTTNPYSDLASALGAWDEVDDQEGSHPLYVLVFADEEEREVTRYIGTSGYAVDWEGWARIQLERGDEALASNFGIDIRILDLLEWDSNDSLDSKSALWYELEADTGQYLRQWYEGEWWNNYVDAIIGITGQETNDGVAGLASNSTDLDAGRVFVLLSWQIYWADDNHAQHEVSHLYYAPDHSPYCCAMAYHKHYQSIIWEDGFWWIYDQVPCSYTTHSYCTSCSQTIQQKSERYHLRALTISASSGGTTNPTFGNHFYGNGESVTITAIPDSGCTFECWLLNGGTVHNNPIIITMDSDHTLKAYFAEPVCAMKTKINGTFYMPNIVTNLLKIELLFDNQNLTGDQTGGTSPYGTVANYPNAIINVFDSTVISGHVGESEGNPNWNYMADINPDRTINLFDAIWISRNAGKTGTYITSLAGVTVVFNTGEEKYPDGDGFVAIPENATSFTVKRNGTPVGAMIIFW